MWRKYAGAGVLVLAGLSTVSLLNAQDTDGEAKPRPSLFKKLRQSVGLGGEETPPPTETPRSTGSPAVSQPGMPAPPTGQRPPTATAPGTTPAPGTATANPPRGSGLPNYNGANPPAKAGVAGAAAGGYPGGPPTSAAYANGAPRTQTPPQAGATPPANQFRDPAVAPRTAVGPTPGTTPPANAFRDPSPAAPRKSAPANVDAGNPFAARPADVSISDGPSGPSQYAPANRPAPGRQVELTAKREETYRPAANSSAAGNAPGTASSESAPPTRGGYPPESSPYSGVNPRNDAAYPGPGYPGAGNATSAAPANRPAVTGPVAPSKPLAGGTDSPFSISPSEPVREAAREPVREPVREPARAGLSGTIPGSNPAAGTQTPAGPAQNNATGSAPLASPFEERTFRVGDGRPEGSPYSRPVEATANRPVERPLETSRPAEASRPVETIRPGAEPVRPSETTTPGRAALTQKNEARPPVETRHVVAAPKPPLATRQEEPRPVVVAPSHLADPEHPIRAAVAPQDSVLLTGASPVLVVETSGPRKIVIGKTALYSILVKNTGTVAARDVVVSIKVPEWAEVLGMEAKGREVEKPSNTSDGVQWTLRRLKGKSEEELELKVVPRQGLPFDLSIEVSHAPVTTQASVEVQEPKLMMALTGPGEVMYGKQELYKLTLSNPGTGDAEGVELTLLPTNAGDPTPAPHRIGGLKAGDSKVIELELTARQGGTLKINAVATAAGGLKTTIDESILVRKAALIVSVNGSKFRYAGTESNYEIQVSNPGNATAQNVQLHAMLPPGAKFISASNRGRYDAENGRVVWQLSNMAPAAEQTVSWACELTEAGLTRLQASCSADNELRNSAAFLTDVEAVADLALSVTDPRGPLPVGHEMVYEVTIENRGTKAAEGVEIVGSFSDGVEPVAASGGPTFQIKTGQISFAPIPVIEPGQSITLKVHAKASTAGNHVFRAELICDAIDTRIAKEESTRFFGDEPRVEHTAEKQPAGKQPQPRR